MYKEDIKDIEMYDLNRNLRVLVVYYFLGTSPTDPPKILTIVGWRKPSWKYNNINFINN